MNYPEVYKVLLLVRKGFRREKFMRVMERFGKQVDNPGSCRTSVEIPTSD